MIGKSKIKDQKSKISNTVKSSTPRRGSASSMEELLKKSGYAASALRRGQVITGMVATLSPKQILLDIGGKAEAIVLEKDKRILSDLLSTLKIGDKVQASVLDPESDQGYPVVSLRTFRSTKAWERLRQAAENDATVEAEVLEETRGGLLVSVFGMQGFIPTSHLSEVKEEEKPSIGSKITVKILELDPTSARLVLSQKQALVKTADVEKILSQIEIGKTYKGVVSGITKFGIFVTLTANGNINFSKASIEGLVHISEISWEKVDDLEKLFEVGAEVEVMVIGIDRKQRKLTLSLKKLQEDPFQKVAELYSKDQEVKGTISKVGGLGVFVRLDEGLKGGWVEGLIHQSKIPPGIELTEGEKITCTIESIDSKRRRISLVPVLREKPVGYR